MRENLTIKLKEAGHKGFKTNEQIAMKYFGLVVLKINSDNKIESKQQRKIISGCE